MKRPDKISGEQGDYIVFLEKMLGEFSSKKTAIRSYLALKKIIDDTNHLVMKGITIENDETKKITSVDIVSEMSLTSKDDKTIDRIFKFIDKLGVYNSELKKMEEGFNPEDIDNEKEIMKGEYSVEARIHR